MSVFAACPHALARRGHRVAQLRAARPRRAARPGRARELLDADVHQLAAPGAVRPRVVAGLPGRRADRDRRPHAGVLVRARHRPRAAGGGGAGHRLPGRGRQRLRGLDRLRQPLLAGALLRRPGRHHPRPALRRGALRGVGARHPAPARRRARARRRSKGPAWRRRPTGTTCARPRRISATARGERRRVTATRPAPEPLGAHRRVDDRAARTSCSTRPAAASRSASTRATRIS